MQKLLQKIGRALILAASHGGDIEHGSGYGNVTGSIVEITNTKVVVELHGMGLARSRIEFNLEEEEVLEVQNRREVI